eukprot:s528_g10.t1
MQDDFLIEVIEKDVVTPQAVAQTPPAARKPWTPKTRQEEEPEEPEPTPVVVPDEPDDPEIEVSKPKPPPPAPTPQASPKKQASRPEPTSMPAATEPEKVPVAAVVQCGLFRIKDGLGFSWERQSEVPKSPEEVEEDYERPASEGLSSTRPPSQQCLSGQEFREAIALAWERALAEVELVWAQKHPVELEGLERIHQLIGMGKDDGKDCEELPEADSLDETCVGESRSLEQEEEEDDASDGEATALEAFREAMDQFFTVFKRSNSVGSQESSTLADCVRRVERKRYARQLERRTGSAALERRTQRLPEAALGRGPPAEQGLHALLKLRRVWSLLSDVQDAVEFNAACEAQVEFYVGLEFLLSGLLRTCSVG